MAATSVNGVKIISGKQEAKAREFVRTSLKNTELSLNYRLVETTHPTTKYRMVAVSIQFMATQTLADFSPLKYSRRATSFSFTHKIPTAFIELHNYVTQDDTPRKEVRAAFKAQLTFVNAKLRQEILGGRESMRATMSVQLPFKVITLPKCLDIQILLNPKKEEIGLVITFTEVAVEKVEQADRLTSTLTRQH
ncbi:hypothetical protein SARC_01734 [Sphaeroforma arctica JP610]|uniref:Uncharacterized protein n=1 Tax=Sphaeroforma arctica JP610 TaxID=667725 RepID=A0A0L0GD13_9EUKA|nr:hypothetical protein SARC_01734 [Sphaeroforma arctica JP610]KNC86118.1 hypothetical protein SARC_01734 [Sphaeroforma arctica JP610]|eukprot:XP_014160020.1 hypothetical protein SARC_01734 [Sphaeroforma arctica JP610]